MLIISKSRCCLTAVSGLSSLTGRLQSHFFKLLHAYSTVCIAIVSFLLGLLLKEEGKNISVPFVKKPVFKPHEVKARLATQLAQKSVMNPRSSGKISTLTCDGIVFTRVFNMCCHFSFWIRQLSLLSCVFLCASLLLHLSACRSIERRMRGSDVVTVCAGYRHPHCK